MNIGIFGATGNIGQRIVAEALRRGHHVTAIARHESRIPKTTNAKVTWRVADVLEPDAIACVLDDLDALVSTFQPGNASEDLTEVIRRSIANPGAYAAAAKALLSAIAKMRPSLRLIVVGGAGSLEVAPGLTLVESPQLGAALEAIGIPRGYAVAVAGHRDALNVLRLSNRNWTYFSPPEHIGPGERTGRFRLGGDQPVTGADGTSRISYEDFAVALVDEVEIPRYIQRRFTIGY